jgi:hypothetical protein
VVTFAMLARLSFEKLRFKGEHFNWYPSSREGTISQKPRK